MLVSLDETGFLADARRAGNLARPTAHLGNPCLRRRDARFARRGRYSRAPYVALGESLPAALVFSLRSRRPCLRRRDARFARQGRYSRRRSTSKYPRAPYGALGESSPAALVVSLRSRVFSLPSVARVAPLLGSTDSPLVPTRPSPRPRPRSRPKSANTWARRATRHHAKRPETPLRDGR